ncbi:hypothetical protein EON67_01660 [archaeon]|nr:MAG: hypothetical protein EON67_01660 [archaeon]
MSRVSSSASMMMSPRMGVGLASLGSFRADATTRRSMSFMASPSGTIDPVESPGGGSQLSPATGGAPGGTSHLSSPGALRRLSSLSAPAMQQATTAGTLTPPRELLGCSDGSDSGQRSRASSGSKSDVGMDASSLLLRHAASASSSASVRGAATRSAFMSPPPMIAEQYATDEEHTAYSHRSGASVDSELSDVSNFNAATFASPADADVRGQ